MSKGLVIDAFLQGSGNKKLDEVLIAHTNQYSQYTSKSFIALIKNYGWVFSYNRKVNHYDNTFMKSFYLQIIGLKTH